MVFSIVTKIIRHIELLREKQVTVNAHISLQNIYNKGYADGINDALNEVRREL